MKKSSETNSVDAAKIIFASSAFRIARPFVICAARTDDFAALARDMSESDKMELSLGRDGDWQATIEATCTGSTESYVIRHPAGNGVLLFGVTNIAPLGAGRIWMMQSQAFQAAASASGLPYALKLKSAGQAFIADRLTVYGTVFNFVSASRTAEIRWLKQLGFQFHSGPLALAPEMLMFGLGPGFKALAGSSGVWSAFFSRKSLPVSEFTDVP